MAAKAAEDFYKDILEFSGKNSGDTIQVDEFLDYAKDRDVEMSVAKIVELTIYNAWNQAQCSQKAKDIMSQRKEARREHVEAVALSTHSTERISEREESERSFATHTSSASVGRTRQNSSLFFPEQMEQPVALSNQSRAMVEQTASFREAQSHMVRNVAPQSFMLHNSVPQQPVVRNSTPQSFPTLLGTSASNHKARTLATQSNAPSYLRMPLTAPPLVTQQRPVWLSTTYSPRPRP